MSNDYCTQANIESTFGTNNVAKWSDIEESGSANTTQIAWAIDVASDEIDDYLRGTHYTIPLKTPAGATPASITDIAATLAGVRLFEMRGVQNLENNGEANHALAWHRQWVRQSLLDIRSGVRRIDAV